MAVRKEVFFWRHSIHDNYKRFRGEEERENHFPPFSTTEIHFSFFLLPSLLHHTNTTKKGGKEDSIVGPLHHHYSDAFALSAPLAVTVWKKEKRGSLEAEKRGRGRGRGTLGRLSGGLSQRRSPLGGERGRRASLHLLFLFFGKGMGKRGWGGCKEASIASISFSWR